MEREAVASGVVADSELPTELIVHEGDRVDSEVIEIPKIKKIASNYQERCE